MSMRIFVTAAVAGLVCAPALAAAPAADAGPWAKVPALPTACYSNQDQWHEQNSTALAAVQQDHSDQNDVNSAIQQKANKAQEENPMAMAQALQQAMMNDPQNAQKYMEQMTQRGEAAVTETPAQLAKEQQLEAESKAIVKQYHAALAQAGSAAEARWAVLKKKRGYGPEVRGPSEAGEPDWVYQEWNGILHDFDAAYASNCAQWWTAGSPIHAYLKRYKDYLVQERTPSRKKLIDDPALDQYKLLNVSTTGYRTIADYEAAELYMQRAGTMFSERRPEPRCQSADRCDVY